MGDKKSFTAFYPYYLSEHSNRTCRRLHFIGTTLGLIAVLHAFSTLNLWWLAAGLAAGYAPRLSPIRSTASWATG